MRVFSNCYVGTAIFLNTFGTEFAFTRERRSNAIAFNFYGTFSTAQLQELVDFSNIQEQDISDRILWLGRELEMNGVFTTIYDPITKYPTSFSCSPPSSYGSKLLQAYKILGGTPERDMLLRTSDQPVFLVKGTNISNDPNEQSSGYSETYSNGRLYRGTQRFDRDIGQKVQRLKLWQLEAIKRKREHLEYKIKRCLDYSDQLQNEIDQLTTIIAPNNSKSVTSMIGDIQGSMLLPGTMNVVNSTSDFYGLEIGQVADKTSPSDLETAAANKLRGMT